MSEETENTENETAEAEVINVEENERSDTDSLNSFMFKGSIEIFPFDEIHHLSKGEVKACRARSKRGEDLFAMLCKKEIFPRASSTSKYNTLQTSYIGSLFASGVSDLSKKVKSLLPQQTYIYVFENIYGAPLWKEGDSLCMGLKPEVVRYAVLPSLVSALKDFKQSDLLHGSIHVGNVFLPIGIESLSTGDSVNGVSIGECLSTPFSYDMPELSLPVGRASVSPIRRGDGTFEDEIYSLGVLLSVLLRKADPCAGMNEKQILQSKIDHGSYQTIVGDNRIDVFFLNALRGMLQDDPEQRWTLDDIVQWMDGQRIGVKQGGVKRLNANRPLPFNGKTYLRPEVLAFEFQENIDEAHQLIIGGELGKWVDRSVANPALKAHLQVAMEQAEKYGQKVGYMERKVAQVALMFNNSSPLFYKNVKFMPDGLRTSFAYDAALEADLTPYAEIIEMNIMPFWMEHQKSGAVDVPAMLSKLESCRMSLKQSGFGYGMERCVYVLCEDAPCLSPMLSDYYIKTPEDYFIAFNDMCLNGKAPDRVVDRHVAAFLSVRDRQMIDAYMLDINSSTDHIRALAIMRMLATIQFRANMGKATGISSWIVENLSKPLLERLHDRNLREKISKKLRKIAGSGDVAMIASLFEAESTLLQDQNSYTQATQQYQDLLKQEELLDYNIQHNKRYGQGKGREVASIVSITLSFIIVMIVLSMFFGEKLLGG